jgi:hypothetical protein
MVILIVALAGGLLAGTLLGGSLANLGRLSLRLPWLVPIALSLQIVAFSPVGHRLPSVAVVTMHVASYGLLLACVAANLRRPPVMCFGVGVFCNAITIVVNGGYMPASRAALRLAGLPVAAQPHNNSELAGSDAHLAFLGDVFAVPHAVPLANIFSLGDILVAIGLAWLVAAGMRRSAAPAGQPAAVASVAESPALVLRCTRCGATFADRWRLRAHLADHGVALPTDWQSPISRKPRVVAVPLELSARARTDPPMRTSVSRYRPGS